MGIRASDILIMINFVLSAEKLSLVLFRRFIFKDIKLKFKLESDNCCAYEFMVAGIVIMIMP